MKRLVGIYSHPDQIVIYPDGGKFHIVALHFQAEVTEGEPGMSNETTDFGYFSLQEIEAIEMFGRHKERIMDTVENHADAFIR